MVFYNPNDKFWYADTPAEMPHTTRPASVKIISTKQILTLAESGEWELESTWDGLIVSEVKSMRDGIRQSGRRVALYESLSSSDGLLDDLAVTKEAIYVKKLLLTGTGFLLENSTEHRYNGLWVGMGENTQGTANGGSQGTHWYLHQSGKYVLCWSTAYDGYWWINNVNSPMDDNGQSFSYVTAQTKPANPLVLPPSSGWGNNSDYGYSFSSGTWSLYEEEMKEVEAWELYALLVPLPPTTGTATLQSVNGVIRWG